MSSNALGTGSLFCTVLCIQYVHCTVGDTEAKESKKNNYIIFRAQVCNKHTSAPFRPAH
jgi:hypothetical protein